MSETKICKICKTEKPLNEDYYQVRKSSKDGFRNECKDCRKEYLKNYYEKNKEKIIKHNSEYRKENWEQHKERNEKYLEKNKETLKTKRKVYYQQNKQTINQKKKIYTLNNKEYFAEYYLEWARKNPDKCREKRHRREAKAKQLESTFTASQWSEVLKIFNNKCAYCGKETKLEQEHFIPLSKDGEYTRKNIIPACKNCNSSKQDKNFYEWYINFEHYNQEREHFILNYLSNCEIEEGDYNSNAS